MSDNQRQPREYDPDYLAWLRTQPCCICGDDVSVEASHLRVGSINHGKPIGALGMKSSDRWALPLCSRHHRESHQHNELEWWMSRGIDPFALSLHYRRQR